MYRRSSDIGPIAAIAFIVLVNLAWLGLLAWGLIELVQWVTSK